MISRCYLEITNVCNLSCVFCPKTQRGKRSLTPHEFDVLTDKLKGQVKFLYFHLMGEPFLHPHLPQFISLAKQKGLIPVLTTNGTLLKGAEEVMSALPYKIQISLHSHEGNGREFMDDYVGDVMRFTQKAALQGTIVVLRLWNQGGYDTKNEEIIKLIMQSQPQPWESRSDGWKLADNIYIEYDRMFEWPDSARSELKETDLFCYALRNQIGVLVDGSVVPCCLDHDGDIVLGNLFEQSLNDILSSARAREMYDGFTQHKAVEHLCKRCGYAAVTKQFHS